MATLPRRSFLATTATTAVAFAQSGSGVEEIRKAEMTWADAVKKGNQTAIAGLLSDDLVYTHSTGIVESKSEYLGKLKSGAQQYTGLDYADTKYRRYGDTGIVNTRIRMRGATKGTPFDNELLMIHVWQKQNGNWKLVAHQTTRLN